MDSRSASSGEDAASSRVQTGSATRAMIMSRISKHWCCSTTIAETISREESISRLVDGRSKRRVRRPRDNPSTCLADDALQQGEERGNGRSSRARGTRTPRTSVITCATTTTSALLRSVEIFSLNVRRQLLDDAAVSCDASSRINIDSVRSFATPDHLMLDSDPNIGPLTSRWELDKFKNC